MLPTTVLENPVHEAGHTFVDFSADASTVVTAGSDGQLHLFQVKDLQAGKFEPIKSEISQQ
jgi:hypothetical protein